MMIEQHADGDWIVKSNPYQRSLTIDTVHSRRAMDMPFKLAVDWRHVFGLKDEDEPFANVVVKRIEHLTLRVGERMQAKEIDYVISEEDYGFTIHFTQPGPAIQFSCGHGGCLMIEQVGEGSLQAFEVVVNFHLE